MVKARKMHIPSILCWGLTNRLPLFPWETKKGGATTEEDEVNIFLEIMNMALMQDKKINGTVGSFDVEHFFGQSRSKKLKNQQWRRHHEKAALFINILRRENLYLLQCRILWRSVTSVRRKPVLRTRASTTSFKKAIIRSFYQEPIGLSLTPERLSNSSLSTTQASHQSLSAMRRADVLIYWISRPLLVPCQVPRVSALPNSQGSSPSIHWLHSLFRLRRVARLHRPLLAA